MRGKIRRYVTLGEYRTATQHVPLRLSCHMVPPDGIQFSFLEAPALLKFIFWVHNTHLTSVFFCKDDPLHTTQLSYTCGRASVCSYYSSSPPASFRDAASSGCSHRVVHGGLRVPVKMFMLAVYFGTLYGASQGYAWTLYAETTHDEEVRWHGLFCVYCTYMLPSDPSIDRGLVKVFFHWASCHRPRGRLDWQHPCFS